ncbi:MAG: hypothetical protein ACFB8W_23675 [Elainellaceae cyanobacterium]
MNRLGKKRLDVALAIAGYATGGAAAAAAPTPVLELPKQVMFTASDILMYASIWRTYFEEDLSEKHLMDMLTELGIVTIAACGTAYLVGRASTALLCEISDWAGPLGWWMAAVVSGSLAGLSGVAWAVYCDRRYHELHLASLST